MKSQRADQDYVIVEPPIDTFKGSNIDLNNPPKVSFCIPTKNRERSIRACLESIICQDYPDIEIVVVDNGSTDNSPVIAREFTDNVYFCEGPLGKVRQLSIEKSSGEILALLDDDIVIPHKNWLMNAIKYFTYSNEVSTVWPRNIAPPGAPLSTRLYFNLGEVIMEDRIKKRRGLWGGGNALFLRKFIEEIGGVNTSIHWGEDYDWAGKLKNKGYQVVCIKDPLYHDALRSLKEFTRRQFIGAATFTTPEGFRLLNLSLGSVLYEQIILGTKGMVFGLIKNRDISWLLFPLFITIRIFAYGWTYLLNRVRRLFSKGEVEAPRQ